MALIVIGANHRTAPLELCEKLFVTAEDLPKVLAGAARRDHVAEVVVVSTCNRTELYADVELFHDTFDGLCNVLTERVTLAVPDVVDDMFVEYGDAAIAHLFSVAAGLESVVVGETEILGQLKRAWEVARAEGTAGPRMNALFRHAVQAGKRARTETGISRSVASASAAAVALAEDRLGGLENRRALVLGAGQMGTRMATALAGSGLADVVVANRAPERAAELAARIEGRTIPFQERYRELADVDVLLTSTSAPGVVIEREALAPVVAARGGRPLVIVDIAIPRDVDPDVARLEGVALLGMEDLRTFTDAGLAQRRGEITAVEAILESERLSFAAKARARSNASVIAGMRQRAEELRVMELERFSSRLSTMSAEQRDTVEALTRGIVAKLLHRPSVRLGELADTPRGDRVVDAIAELLSVDDADDRVTDTEYPA